MLTLKNPIIENSCASRDIQNDLLSIYKDGLLEDTLPFWLNKAIDRDYGGYITSLDRDGSILDTDKGIWVQGRFAWLLGHLYNKFEKKQEWIDACHSGIDFLDKYGFDPNDRRMWFHVTRDGQPIRKRRYAFSESFACIAYAEYGKAAGDSRYTQKAIDLFRQYQSYLDGPDFVSKFTANRPSIGIGRYMIDIVTCQILREAAGFEEASEIIDRCIDLILRLFIKEDIRCVMETVSTEGEIIDHFDGRLLNPGHAIECAWFIIKEGKIRRNEAYIQLGCKMLDWMWERGWDEQFGGILYFRDVYGKPVQEYWHDMKFWWPHNETIIATLLAYSLTGENKYAEMHQKVHNWAYRYFPDKEYGEWFGYLHRDGSISSTFKGNMWKGPFHMPRMQLECRQILEEMMRL